MSIIQLLRIYHSFLLKKWYVCLYILCIFFAVFLGLIISNDRLETSSLLKIGIVDEDKSKETEMILQTVGDGKNIGNQLRLISYNTEEAKQQLEKHKIDGYFVLEQGMTKQFYKNGELPIRVHTYDENSVQSIIINQFADAVYSRLMLSEAGIISYAKISGEIDEDKLVQVMLDLLFVGLDREAAFETEEVQTYEILKYILISAFFISIYLFYWSITTLLQMNQSKVLKVRLRMYPFIQEKIIITRAIFSLMYTVVFTAVLACLIYPYTALESYNIPIFISSLSIYVLTIFLVSLILELLNIPFLKFILAGLIVLASGATIPLLYLKHTGLDEQLFAQFFYRLLELLHHNYIVDWTPVFYGQLALVILTAILLIFWKGSRA
ncbi:MAG: ABC transporter permease [Kurthia sp.]|nr:ABC transporter permease [Candidatus Kurthia equi]